MTTIDKLRDLTFYIIRKLNDLIINLPIEEQPQPEPEPEPQQIRVRSNYSIDERIKELRRSLDRKKQPTQIVTEDPSPPIEEQPQPQRRVMTDLEKIDERIKELRRSLDRKKQPTQIVTEQIEEQPPEIVTQDPSQPIEEEHNKECKSIGNRIQNLKEQAIEKAREEVLGDDVIKGMLKRIEEESYKIIEQKHILNLLKKELKRTVNSKERYENYKEHEIETIQLMIELELKSKVDYERDLKKDTDSLIIYVMLVLNK